MTSEEHEARIHALEQARKELEDSFLVMTHLETRQNNVIRDLARRSDEVDRQLEFQRKLNADTDKRIADLVSAIGQLISKH